ncbi:MAG: YcxB family protein [Gemmataceae bacterium]|nr:YcxB family protein [Gemmataceae bacterium]
MADGGPVVRVKAAPKLEDWLGLNAAIFRRRIRAWWFTYFFVGWAVLGLVLMVVDGPSTVPLPAVLLPIGLALVFSVLLPLLIRVNAQQVWDRSEEIREERAYEFSRGGVTYTGAASSGRISWSVFKRAEVARGYMILYTGQPAVVLIPESALTGEQREELDRLLRAHVPGFAGLPPRR